MTDMSVKGFENNGFSVANDEELKSRLMVANDQVHHSGANVKRL